MRKDLVKSTGISDFEYVAKSFAARCPKKSNASKPLVSEDMPKMRCTSSTYSSGIPTLNENVCDEIDIVFLGDWCDARGLVRHSCNERHELDHLDHVCSRHVVEQAELDPLQ
jgi:hypothetical protein